jgi:hypothetical protein
MVTENGISDFCLKMDSVGPKLHQISPKNFCSVCNIHTIVHQCYVYCYEVLCPCSGQDSYERDRDTQVALGPLGPLQNRQRLLPFSEFENPRDIS